MAKLHYGKLTPSAFAATTSQDGFPPANVGTPALARPWKSTSAAANDLIITLLAAVANPTLHVHDANFATADVYKSVDGVAWVLYGVLTTYYGKEGRRRGSITITDPTVKAIKITPAGAPTDGLALWRVGFAPVFSSVLTFASPLQFPYTPRFVRPQLRQTLTNKQEAVAATGTGFHVVELPFKPRDDEDLEPVLRVVQGGAIALLDLELANYPWQVWPVRYIDDEIGERFLEPKVSELALLFHEVVAS